MHTCLESLVGYGPLGRFLCYVVQNTLVLHGCLVVLLVAFLVPCLGEFLICADMPVTMNLSEIVID